MKKDYEQMIKKLKVDSREFEGKKKKELEDLEKVKIDEIDKIKKEKKVLEQR